MTDSFRNRPTSQLLARIAQARECDDLASVKDELWACVARGRERVENVVDHAIAKGMFPKADRRDVVQKTLIRAFRRLPHTLDDLDKEGVFFASMITVAKKQCLDEQRAFITRDRREKSVDTPAGWSDTDDPVGRYDKATAKQAGESHDDAEHARDVHEVLQRALEDLKERERKVVVAYMAGADDAVLAEEFGISVNGVQAIRSRTFKKLAKNKELRGLNDR